MFKANPQRNEKKANMKELFKFTGKTFVQSYDGNDKSRFLNAIKITNRK